MAIIRLNKYLADSGVCSRRSADEFIAKGKVRVNGIVVSELGSKVDTDNDRVEAAGKVLKPVSKKVYIMLNKPIGIVCTAKDEFNRATVLDLVKEIKTRLFYVGRLDVDTSGLVLLTNDGDLANCISHPSSLVEKEYIARIKGKITSNAIKAFQNGIDIGDYVTAPANISVIREFENSCEVRILIHEGKNRQIRKMCEEIGHPVISLIRTAIGQIKLGKLAEGGFRHLKQEEINYLKQL